MLTSDRPWDLRVGSDGSTWPAWPAARDRLARDPHSRHVTVTDSGHVFVVEPPVLVGAVREAVHRARDTGNRRRGPTTGARDRCA
ncbi:hypothetical protein [Streptomyces sp. NPDC017949]|uniref:hypothetical protein n=1 Tax=Streptomyces sp. NPDC017949 TaxID=3365020 RepID=UPI0037B62EBF